MTPERLNDEPLPEGFRMTELGALPAHWKVVKLGEVFDIMQGKSLSSKKNKGVRPRLFLRTSNIYWGKIDLTSVDSMDFSEEEETKYALQYGDLLVCEGGEVGRTAFWEGNISNIFFQNHLHRLRAKNQNVSPRFVMYWLQTAFTLLNLYTGTSNKTTIPNLSRGRLSAFPIPLPPLEEQQEIAHALRTVQEARDAAAGVAAALRELKRSLMRHLFAYGPIPPETADRLPLQDTELGALPAHWKVVKLGEVITLDGKFVNPANFQDKRYIGLEHIDPGNVRISRWGDPSSVSSSKTYFIQNQILYGKLRPYLDKAVVADFEGICSTDILVFEVNRKVANPLYVAYLLHTKKFIEYADSTSTGVNHPRTSWTALKKWMFPLPPLEEQQEIARILQAVDAKIAAEESRRQALEALFQSLLHHLMTGKVRVPPTLEAPHASCE